MARNHIRHTADAVAGSHWVAATWSSTGDNYATPDIAALHAHQRLPLAYDEAVLAPQSICTSAAYFTVPRLRVHGYGGTGESSASGYFYIYPVSCAPSLLIIAMRDGTMTILDHNYECCASQKYRVSKHRSCIF